LFNFLLFLSNFSRLSFDEIKMNIQTVQRAWADVLSVSRPCPSVWNSLADYLRDPVLELNSFRRQSMTFLHARCYAQRTERIRHYMTVRCIILLFTYTFLLILLNSIIPSCAHTAETEKGHYPPLTHKKVANGPAPIFIYF